MLLAKTVSAHGACAGPNCRIGQPLDVLLARAPAEGSDLAAGEGVLACLYHRVQLRAAMHRPAEE